MEQPNLKLTYFISPGRGECARLMLNHGGLKWEDHVFPAAWPVWQYIGCYTGRYTPDDQLLMKHQTQSQEDWMKVKHTFPYGQMPTLEVDGKVLAQSDAIERYIAKLVGLYPDDAWEAAKVDEIAAFVYESREELLRCHVLPPETRLKARLEVANTRIKYMLDKLASMLEMTGGKHFVGGKLTWADFKTYDVCSALVSGFIDGLPQNLLEPYPILKEFHARMAALPSVAKFYEEIQNGVRMPYKKVPVCSE